MPSKGEFHSDEARRLIINARKRQVPPPLARRGITPNEYFGALARGRRWCSGYWCKKFRPVNDFSPTAGKCKRCAAKMQQQRREGLSKEKREEQAQYLRDWRKKNTAHVRTQHLARKYGVTHEWYETKLAEQGGHCAMCPETKVISGRKYLFVDHHHGTGSSRGILCYRCNTFIGQLEKPGWLDAALAYLGKYKT